MASRIAVVIVGIGTIAPSDRDWGRSGKEKTNPPRENDISADGMTARHEGERGGGEGDGAREKQIYDLRARMMFQQCGRLEQLLAEYCNHYVSISLPECLARLSPSRFKNDHDIYIYI